MVKMFMFIVLLVGFNANAYNQLKPISVTPTQIDVDYLKEVKPILDKRCVSCHSCYNSPCQLKLSSYEGLDRGTSKDLVYLGERLHAQDPTRLFIDAKNTIEWRKKGFNSVTDSNSLTNTNTSIMLQLLEHKMKNPKSIGEYRSEDDLTCAKDINELSEFLDEHPNQGMPYGFPPLNTKEFNTIKQWLYQGAKQSPIPQTQMPDEVKMFEEFFNKKDAKHIMSARYIYEHLFLAHLSFASKPNEFYELIRSRTPHPKEIDVIATLRPYDDPKVNQFYYRFQKIHSTIVHKTHMVYDLSKDKLQRYKTLFTKSKWTQTPYNIGYKTKFNAQPFKIFEQIPATSRYQFLLDNNEYIIRTFIRGPVCKGQIALNVIHDHFWVTFMKPQFDLSLKEKTFLKSQYQNLQMPIEAGSDMGVIDIVKGKYNNKATSYYKQRQKLYDRVYKEGLDEESLTDDILTIYRHFDSASVHKGALGELPRTAWVIDYPLLERIYYTLVAGFDVFGNAGHQLSIRQYMNRLRIEGETYFTNLLPLKERQEIINSWYLDNNTLISWYLKEKNNDIFYLSKNRAKKRYSTNDSKRELLESIVKEFDKINYFYEGEEIPKVPKSYQSKKEIIAGFRSLVQKGTAFIQHASGINSNLAFIRIKNIPKSEDIVLTAVVNRWHDNVSFMFNEQGRLDSSKDDIDFIEGFIGSYPNLFLVLDHKDLPDFIDMIKSYDGSQKYVDKFMKYGIFRGDEDFWEHFDWFQTRFYEDDPHTAGLFDLNRYYYKVLR